MPGELTAKPRELVKLYFKFRCTFAGCSKGFLDAVELRYHKVNDPDHFYCEDDGYEAKDYEDMKKHHATSDKHNACPSSRCGLNTLTTVEALRLHIMTRHRSIQFTHCSGCDTQYQSPEALWGHLEMQEAPVVCGGPMNVNIALARFKADKRKYVWREWMKKTGWHHHDQRRWYSDPPDWFLARLNSNNEYVAPVYDRPSMPEDWVVDTSKGWDDDRETSASTSANGWSCKPANDWTSPPSTEPEDWPTLGPGAAQKTQSQESTRNGTIRHGADQSSSKKAQRGPESPVPTISTTPAFTRNRQNKKPKSAWSTIAAKN